MYIVKQLYTVNWRRHAKDVAQRKAKLN